MARRLVGQQINIQSVKLGFIDAGGQTVVIAGNQQMLTGLALRQAGNVGRHGAERHFTGLATGDIQRTQDLVLGKLAVWVVGIPIHPLHIQCQTCLFQSLHQSGNQSLSVIGLGFGLGIGIGVCALLEQPSHVIAVYQGNAATTAGLCMVLARMRGAVFVLHRG